MDDVQLREEAYQLARIWLREWAPDQDEDGDTAEDDTPVYVEVGGEG